MTRTLGEDELRAIATFEAVTDVPADDCLIEDDRILFVVPAGQMGAAIGPAGRTVDRLERRMGRSVKLVEAAETAENFVANALAPAAVYNVTVSEGETTVAYAEVDRADRGVAIGADGRNIAAARRLAARHFDIDDIQLV